LATNEQVACYLDSVLKSKMNTDILTALRAHAAADYPRESCGVIVQRQGQERYWPCRNLAADNAHFVLHPEDYAAAEEAGEVVCIVHSHPNLPPTPSEADRVMCERTGLPWLIVNWPTGAVHQFKPSGYQAPLIGRPFSHSILDCYTLIRDYYQRALQIELPDFERAPEWWTQGGNLYLDHFDEAGFVEVACETLRPHDVLLMQNASPVPNHSAVYLGNGRLLQHCQGHLSGESIYGGYWQKCTTHVLRHRRLLHA
jgi:proteasome lid subunit RPN8/RPN11